MKRSDGSHRIMDSLCTYLKQLSDLESPHRFFMLRERKEKLTDELGRLPF